MGRVSITFWGIAFALAIALLVATASYAQEGLDLIVIGLICFDGLAMLVLVVASGFAAYRWRWARPLFAPLNLGALLLILLGMSWQFYEWVLFQTGLPQAESYMRLAEPALLAYQEQHGRLPKTLMELGLAVQPPEGLKYSPGSETFTVTFYDDYYCGKGQWFLDD